MQAGGNTCPAELPDDPSSQRTRLWRCGHARSSFSMQSMPNNMQAGGDTCPAGPLDIAESLLNSPRRCGRLRIPDSFFSSSSLNSPVVVDGCVSLNPSSFFSPSKEPRCSYRRQVQSPSTFSCRIARPRTASQSLASVLRLNLSVAGAFAESEDASPSGPQNSTDANLPKDESNSIDHAITPCHAHANPAEDTHASSAMNLKPQCTSAVEPTACKRLWRFTAHQRAGWWQHLSC